MVYRSNHIGNIDVSVFNIDIKTVNDAQIVFAVKDNEEVLGDETPTDL